MTLYGKPKSDICELSTDRRATRTRTYLFVGTVAVVVFVGWSTPPKIAALSLDAALHKSTRGVTAAVRVRSIACTLPADAAGVKPNGFPTEYVSPPTQAMKPVAFVAPGKWQRLRLPVYSAGNVHVLTSESSTQFFAASHLHDCTCSCADDFSCE